MGGLSREILKWLQSLDLSYSIKNVRRDFSNGFLVAEIFSRYYPQDIQMHSFDNGTSLPKKLDNWAQLERFFTKRGIPIRRDQVDGVLYCQPDAAPPLIENVYTFLTNRVVPAPIKPPVAEVEVIPPFARPTASQLVKDTLKIDPNAADQAHFGKKVEAIIDSHNSTIRNERFVERPSPSRTRVAPHPIAPSLADSVPAHAIQLKEVSVKAVSQASVSQLRSHKDTPGSNQQQQQQQQQQSLSADAVLKPPTSSTSADRDYSLVTILNKAIVKAIPSLQTSKNRFPVFLEGITKFPLDTAFSALRSIETQIPAIANTLLSNPKDGWNLFNPLCSSLNTLPPSSQLFSQLFDLLSEVGKACVSNDPMGSQSLCIGDVLPQFLSILQTNPSKRKHAMEVVYHFTPDAPGAHIKTIKALSDSLGGADVPTLIGCLQHLIQLERTFDDSLLDLYLYYCCIGLTSTSPPLRAISLGMLPRIAENSPSLVIQMLDRLIHLAETDDWWEVQGQLLILAASLLSSVEEDKQDDRVYAIIDIVFSRTSSPHAAKTGLLALAPHLVTHPPIARAYTDALLGLSETVRVAILGLGPSQECVTSVWSPVIVATALAQKALSASLANLEREHMQVVYACIESSSFTESELHGWGEVFSMLKLYLYVGLCDEETSEYAVPVLRTLLLALPEIAIKTFSTLLSSLLMLFPSGPEDCRRRVLELLDELSTFDEPYSSAMYNLVRNFPESLQSCEELRPLFDRVMQMSPIS